MACDRHRFIAVTREHDDRDRRPSDRGRKAVEKFQAVRVGELIVEEDTVGIHFLAEA